MISLLSCEGPTHGKIAIHGLWLLKGNKQAGFEQGLPALLAVATVAAPS